MVQKRTIAEVIGVMGLIIFSGLTIADFNEQTTYYCDDTKIVMNCDRLSDSTKTCYSELANKRCSPGWKSIATVLYQEESNFIDFGTCNREGYVCKNNIMVRKG